jgi:PAS domain S-box-containing protein
MKEAPIPENEIVRVAALESFRILDTPSEENFDDLTKLATTICQTPIALISLIDPTRQWVKSACGFNKSETPRKIAFCAHAILQPDLMIVKDTLTDDRFADNPMVTGAPHIRFYAGAPLRTTEGLCLGTLCVVDRVSRDLTPEQQESLTALGRQIMALMELRRHIQEQARHQEELVLRDRSIDSTTNGILIADVRLPDMPTVYCNAAFEKITGYTKQEVLGRNCRFLQGNDREQPGLLDIRHAIQHGIEARAELRNYKKDGTLFWNEFYLAPVKDDHGAVTHFIGVQNDITQRKEQEGALAQKTKELARSNAELQQFAYVASHDLQEPLRMVASYTQLLRKRYKGKLDQDADEFIGYAEDGAKRMQRLIRELLEYSRVGSETKPFEKTDCEMVLQHVMSNLTASIHEHHAEVAHDALPCIQAIPTLLTQVFQNLIANALKFQGDSKPKIHVRAKPLPDGWEFSVKDNGIGILPDQLDRIFLIFQRLHSREEYPGTGIGLAICKRIVEQHGGTIWVESEQGKGSTFYFTIKTPVPT